MKSLLFHCKKFNANINGLATRGVEVAPEKVTKRTYGRDECIVVFVTVEEHDIIEHVAPKIAKEIEKFSRDTGESNIVLCPFAHLSSKLAPFKTGIAFFDILETTLAKTHDVTRVHFGSDKDLLMHVAGHPGNVRFREF